MNSLQEASFQDLSAILLCLDQYEHAGGKDEAATWRTSVFTELRRRFDTFAENDKIREGARAARNAT